LPLGFQVLYITRDATWLGLAVGSRTVVLIVRITGTVCGPARIPNFHLIIPLAAHLRSGTFGYIDVI